MAEFAPLKPTDSDIQLSDPWRFTHPTYQYCVGHWLLHEGGGRIVRDLSRLGNNGTFVNMTETNWIGGKFGPALTFNNPNAHYVNIPSAQGQLAYAALAQNMTVAYWVQRTSNLGTNDLIIAVSHDDDGVDGWAGYVLNSAGTHVHRWLKSGVAEIDSAIPNVLNQWEHVVWTVNAAYVVSLYLNGVLRFTSGNTQAYTAPAATRQIFLGADGVGGSPLYHWDGELDDVRIYRAVVSAWELYVDPWAPFTMRAPWGFVAAAPAGRTTRNTLASPLGQKLGRGLWTHGGSGD